MSNPLDQIKNNTIANMDNMIPKDGEMVTVSGGLGNKIQKYVKNENGIFYERSTGQEEWKEVDVAQRLESHIISERKRKHKKWL